MNKTEFIKARTDIMSKMLDNPVDGIYPTTIAYAELDDLFDVITEGRYLKSNAQEHRDEMNKVYKIAIREVQYPSTQSVKVHIVGAQSDRLPKELFLSLKDYLLQHAKPNAHVTDSLYPFQPVWEYNVNDAQLQTLIEGFDKRIKVKAYYE